MNFDGRRNIYFISIWISPGARRFYHFPISLFIAPSALAIRMNPALSVWKHFPFPSPYVGFVILPFPNFTIFRSCRPSHLYLMCRISALSVSAFIPIFATPAGFTILPFLPIFPWRRTLQPPLVSHSYRSLPTCRF